MVFTADTLSNNDFKRLSNFINIELGIKLPPAKKVMLECRLQKRLRILNMDTFKDYCKYFFSDEGMKNELQYLINEVTTNKTDFFREPDHFNYLMESALPKLVENMDASKTDCINIWSAGCSTGQEAYTLAMFLNEFKQKYPDLKYYLQASDISSKVLDNAKLGIYKEEEINDIPYSFRSKYFNKSKNKNEKLIRLKPFIRSQVDFKNINLTDDNVFRGRKFHIIFCRNVIIYFDRELQAKLIRNFVRILHTSGYLFLGHSENICSLKVPLELCSTTVYRKIL